MGRLCYPTQAPVRSWFFSQIIVPVQALPAGRQGGYGALFAVMAQFLMSITRVAVQTVSEPEICQGAEFKLRTDERV
jgi:hypothetical protein